MLLNRFANISLGLLYGFSIAEATGQCRAVGEIADIFGFFFDDDLEGIVSHINESLSRARSISQERPASAQAFFCCRQPEPDFRVTSCQILWSRMSSGKVD
jgi:hypothetical protein